MFVISGCDLLRIVFFKEQRDSVLNYTLPISERISFYSCIDHVHSKQHFRYRSFALLKALK